MQLLVDQEEQEEDGGASKTFPADSLAKASIMPMKSGKAPTSQSDENMQVFLEDRKRRLMSELRIDVDEEMDRKQEKIRKREQMS